MHDLLDHTTLLYTDRNRIGNDAIIHARLVIPLVTCCKLPALA